jgi:putative transposase
LLLERDIVVTYETIPCWCNKFSTVFAKRTKAARRRHLDEMFVTPRGERYLQCRAVDDHGAELDVLVQKRRDKATAKRSFLRVLRSNPVPRRIITDQLRSFPAARAELTELAHVKNMFVKAAARVNTLARSGSTSRCRDIRGRRHVIAPTQERFAKWHDWTASTAVDEFI